MKLRRLHDHIAMMFCGLLLPVLFRLILSVCWHVTEVESNTVHVKVTHAILQVGQTSRCGSHEKREAGQYKIGRTTPRLVAQLSNQHCQNEALILAFKTSRAYL